MTSIRKIKIDNNTYELRDARGSQLYVGTCSTAAATNPKVCTVEDFPVDENGKPYKGTEIVVKFTATNSSTSTTPQLNVNGTGAIRIWYNNAVLASAKSAYAGYANRYLHYVYDGTYWVFMGHSVDNNSTYSNVALGQGYAVQNNSAASATITAALGSYALTVNGIVSVKFTHDVPANATLNINGKGAKAIYNKDTAITAGVIKAGDTATFIYNTYYRLISVDRWQDKQDAISDLAAIRSGASKGATAIQQADLAAVATSGNYNDLSNKPTIPNIGTLNTNNSTAQTASSSESFGGNISLHKISKTGSYNDLLDKPTIPTSADINAAKPFLVNIESNSNDEYTCDKTNAEIYAAWQAGRDILLIRNSEFLYKLITPPSLTNCVFGGVDYDDLGIISRYNISTSNNVQRVSESYDSFQRTLVSGTNIKTINNESLLGSGNITIESSSPTNIEYNSSKTALVIGGGSTKYTISLSDGDRLYPSVKINDFTYSTSRFPLEVNSGDILNVVVSAGTGNTCTTTMGGTTVSTSTSFNIQSVSGNIVIKVAGPTSPSGPGGDGPIPVIDP